MRILVAYAERSESASRIAERVGNKLRAMGVQVSVMHVADVPDVHGFDAVVVGSTMVTGAWAWEASDFVRRNSEAVSRVPFWLFSSGPRGAQASPSEDVIEEFEHAIEPVVHWLLAGADELKGVGMAMPPAVESAVAAVLAGR